MTPAAVEYPPNLAHSCGSLQRECCDHLKLFPWSASLMTPIILLCENWAEAEGQKQKRPSAATPMTQQSIGIQMEICRAENNE